MTKDEVKDLFAQEMITRLLDDPRLLYSMHTMLPHWINTYRYASFNDSYRHMLRNHLEHWIK